MVIEIFKYISIGLLINLWRIQLNLLVTVLHSKVYVIRGQLFFNLGFLTLSTLSLNLGEIIQIFTGYFVKVSFLLNKKLVANTNDKISISFLLVVTALERQFDIDIFSTCSDIFGKTI